MAFVNPNMVPLSPHHPSGHPREGPRIIQQGVPGQMNPAHLADRMAQLNVDPQRSAHGGYQKANDFTSVREIYARSPYHYLGYTFFKAEAAPGRKSSWNHVQKTKMNLSQVDLYQLVQKQAKELSAAQQYRALTKLKRTHVDQLIEQHRRSDPRFEWTCVYIKEDSRPVKGKNSRRGDYETLSMDVVIAKRSIPENADVQTHTKPREEHRFDGYATEEVPRPVRIDAQPNGQWRQPVVNHAPVPTTMNHMQQHPPQFYQQPQVPAQGHPDAARQPNVHQAQWSGAHSQQPEMYHHGNPNSGQGPAFQTQDQGNRAVPINPPGPGHTPGHERGPGQNQFNHFARPEVHNQARVNKTPTPRSSDLHVGTETEWPHESSSIGDDESELFDLEDESSATEGSEDVEKASQKSPPWRGSLYRHKSPSKQDRSEVSFRTHYRKKPSRPASDSKLNRARYTASYVEAIPASSKASKRSMQAQSNDNGVRQQQQPRRRPKIVQEPMSSEDQDLAYQKDKVWKGRERNDIRSRILDDREARVERREKMIERQSRMLDERLEEERYLGRHMPLREPLFPRRRYL